ncbi:Fungal transcriptional regulatory protein, N-terminal [Penicillium camemberti]|uniref:Fungal transcriptional regulatory protein, N-terminal n=1 Tax=Penicillium camemberti (strain FM 013) TaxID=1429867 RepID=A0A0G4NV87_PENC3|nr:Fungal transcriptional regulatory protein, N-terminal [Penicillium camemberti]
MSARSPTKTACDGCKIRKIRCRDGYPCHGCRNSRIKCTYLRAQQPRGPQRLRSTTQYLIDQVQRGAAAQPSQNTSHFRELQGAGVTTQFPAGGRSSDHQSESLSFTCQIPTDVMAYPLYIYHVRMYPVWPIVDAKNVISILQQVSGDVDIETYALATAVAAATIAQLRLEKSFSHGKLITADTFAAESMRTRRLSESTSAVSLNKVRTSFFLHIYHESKHAGGSESLLFLREAISLAQMMYLHRETAYIGLPQDEQQIRRRVLWLLFITERGVCILHKLPVVLKTNISTPELDLDGEPQVLPAFLKLLDLFRLFEQSRMFDFIEDDDLGMCSIPDEMRNLDKRSFKMLHDGLQDGSTLMDHISDVQKADLCVTRHWMRMILWKVSAKHHQFFPSQWADSPSFPILVANELLDIVSKLPQAAIKAHGLGMELKLYGIANSLADAVMNMAMLPRASFWNDESRPCNILARLHSFLSTFHGGENKELVDVLYKKMTEAQYKADLAMSCAVHAAMKSRHFIETTASENQLVQEEPPLPGPDHIITIPDWREGGELNPAIHPTGTDWWVPGNLNSVEEQADYPICLDDMLACGFAESCFSSTNNGYPAFSYDPQFTGGM